MKKIDKEKIITDLNKHIDKFMCAMFAERQYYAKTLFKESKSLLAYSYKVIEMIEKLQYGVEFEKRIIEGTLSEAEIEELINSRRKND